MSTEPSVGFTRRVHSGGFAPPPDSRKKIRKAGVFPPGGEGVSGVMSGGGAQERAGPPRTAGARVGRATEEMGGTTSQSRSPSTKRTIDSSMSVKPGLLRVPGVDIRILAFPAGDIVRPVGAYVVGPVRAGG